MLQDKSDCRNRESYCRKYSPKKSRFKIIIEKTPLKILCIINLGTITHLEFVLLLILVK